MLGFAIPATGIGPAMLVTSWRPLPAGVTQAVAPGVLPVGAPGHQLAGCQPFRASADAASSPGGLRAAAAAAGAAAAVAAFVGAAPTRRGWQSPRPSRRGRRRRPTVLLLRAAGSAADSSPSQAAPDGAAEFPWAFRGRVRFRPALVGAPAAAQVGDGVLPLSLLGVTVGGAVCLQYDESPVGPYLEVVKMSSLLLSERFWTVGLWGEQLMVSTAEADGANGRIWGVPSELRDIRLLEPGSSSAVFTECKEEFPWPLPWTDAAASLRIGGWEEMRFAARGAEPFGGLPVWWTPTLKVLWAPVALRREESQGGAAPLRRLRLSAAGLRLRWAPVEGGGDAFDEAPDTSGSPFRLPLPFVIEADGVLIEIGEQFDEL